MTGCGDSSSLANHGGGLYCHAWCISLSWADELQFPGLVTSADAASLHNEHRQFLLLCEKR